MLGMKILLSTTTNVINLIACCTKQINLTFRPPSVWPLFDFLLVSGITCRNKGQQDIVRYSLYVPQKSNNDLYSWDASEFFLCHQNCKCSGSKISVWILSKKLTPNGWIPFFPRETIYIPVSSFYTVTMI